MAAAGTPPEVADQIWDAVGQKYPVGRSGEGVDIARNILYLAAEDSSFVTGIRLVSDGGHTAANVTVDDFTKMS